jgi:hypothetical protein
MPPPTVTSSRTLSTTDIAMIRRADTFFIASVSARAAHTHQGADIDAVDGVDVSHRGGQPGFIGVDAAGDHALDEDTLWVPDFQGNFYFNTLGNLVEHPRAGLVFVDGADVVQVSVDVEIMWEGSLVDAIDGAERLLRLRVTEVVRVVNAVQLRLVDGPPSPYSANTGTFPVR